VFGIALLNFINNLFPLIFLIENKVIYLLIVGSFQQRLNINERPIVNKYCEGKMKSTLKRR